MRQPKKPRTTATITAEQSRLLRLIAQQQNVSVSWLIRRAVARLIESEGSGLQLPLALLPKSGVSGEKN